MVFAGSRRRRPGIGGVDGPGKPTIASRIGDDEIEIVDEGRQRKRRRGCIIPRQSDSKLGVAGLHDDQMFCHRTIRDFIFDHRIVSERVNRLSSADGSESVHAVRSGVSQVVTGVSEQCLQRTVPNISAIGELLSPVLHDQGRNPRDGRRRHRCSAVARIPAARRGAGHAVVVVTLAPRRGDVWLDTSIVARAPTGERSDGVIVGICRTHRDVVLRARWWCGRVKELPATICLPFVAVCPDDADVATEIAPNHGVDQVAGDAVVSRPVTRKTIRRRIGTDRVVRYDGAVVQDGVRVVRFQIAGIGIEEAL